MAENAGGKHGLFSGGLVLFLIVAAAFLSLRALRPPRVLPGSAPAGEFSAERAFEKLKEIAALPHPLGTPAHDLVRETILRMWRDLGCEPEIQNALHFDAKNHRAARVENILVRLSGSRPGPGRALMLASHYDSVPAAPGAADAGAGVVTLLETARALKAGPPLAGEVIFLITDGEEDGLLGASVFQDGHRWAGEVGLVLNFEARGTNGPSLMFESSRGNRALISALADSPHPRAFSMGAMAYRSMPNNSDLSVWLNAGIQGLNFAFIGRPYDYHSSGDNLDRLDLRSLQHHGSYALALVRRFGNEGLPAPAEGEAVYFSLFGDVLVHYSRPAGFALLAAIGGLLAAAGAVGARRRLLHPGSVLRGFVFMLAALILSGAAGFGLTALIRASHGSWLRIGPWMTSPGYFLAVILLAATVTTALYGLLRGRKSGFGTVFGAGIFWLIPAAAATVFASDAGYVGVFPALALALSLLAWALSARAGENNPGPPLWSSALTAILVVFIAAPLVLLLFQAMFLSPLIGALLAVLTSVMLAAAAPAIEICRRGMGRGFSTLFLVLFLVFAGFSALTVRYTDEIPRPLSLQYVQDYDGGRAAWLTVVRPVDPWIEAVAGGSFRPGHPFPELVRRPEAYVFREAALSSAIPPDVRVIEDRNDGLSRFLRLRIVSPRGGRRISITVDAQKIESVKIEGRPLDLIPENASSFGAFVLNPGPEGFEVEMKSASASVRLTIQETNPGFPELPGFSPPPARPEIRPDRTEVLLKKSFVFPSPAKPGAEALIRP